MSGGQGESDYDGVSVSPDVLSDLQEKAKKLLSSIDTELSKEGDTRRNSVKGNVDILLQGKSKSEREDDRRYCITHIHG